LDIASPSLRFWHALGARFISIVSPAVVIDMTLPHFTLQIPRIFATAVFRTPEPRRPYSRDEEQRGSSDSVPAPECRSLHGRPPVSLRAKRNGQDPVVGKHPKPRLRRGKGAYFSCRNSCHQPYRLQAGW